MQDAGSEGRQKTNLLRYETLLLPFITERRNMSINVRPDFFLQATVGVGIIWTVRAIEPQRVAKGDVGNGCHGVNSSYFVFQIKPKDIPYKMHAVHSK